MTHAEKFTAFHSERASDWLFKVCNCTRKYCYCRKCTL